jgi:hypothetical protein
LTTASDTLRRRQEGLDRNGDVGIRDFDKGVITTLGATLYTDGDYYLKVDGMAWAPGDPGVQVLTSFPEDTYEKTRYPLVVVRREDIGPAMTRWHPGSMKYHAPALGALPVTVFKGLPYEKSGFSKMEEQPMSVPFDITYTVAVYARHRGGPAQKHQANLLLQHAMKVYQPYSVVRVTDSIGDVRSYEVFMEGVANLDAIPGTVDRIIGQGLNLRIEAELDLNDPETRRIVTSLTLTVTPL